MPGENLSFAKSSLAYAKLAATPTDTAWSQIYNAGNLFACLSLTMSEPGEEENALQTLGKTLLNNLEAEFFTLEEKNLDTIREAIQKSTGHIPAHVAVNFCLAFFKEHTLYLFLLGSGRVIMKRGEELGVLLEGKEREDKSLLTVSGYLQNADTLILETNQFAKNISDQHIKEALQLSLPNDIAESLSIHMHKKTDGDQAAIVITYHGTSVPTETIETDSEKEDAEETIEEQEDEQRETAHQQHEKPSSTTQVTAKITDVLSKIRLPFPSHNRHIVMGGLTHRKKFFLSITVVILILLIISVSFTKQKQENTQTSALFESIYTPAQKSYDEGKALAGLNDTLSHEDFLKAEKLLSDGRDKFAKDSQEAKQVEELLTKVQSALGGSEAEANTNTSAKEVTVSDTNILAIEKATPTGLGFSQNDSLIFYVTAKDAVSVEKKGGDKTTLITNTGDWKQATAIVPYQANFYVLDQKDGILKYIPSGQSYSKNAYFTKDAPDLTKSVSMAIDSSIWVLFSDGSIKKFTRGEEDSFAIKGLTKPLSNPTKIYTNADIDHIYILDNGNSRVVQLGSDGTFQKEYSAGIIKNAKDFEILESENKIHILSGDKVWEIEM